MSDVRGKRVLLQNSVEQGAQGDGDADTTHPQLGGLAYLCVLGHGLVRFYIDDVPLLQIVIRGVEYVRIAHVQLVHLIGAIR